jgi:hypothetical protein
VSWQVEKFNFGMGSNPNFRAFASSAFNFLVVQAFFTAISG